MENGKVYVVHNDWIQNPEAEEGTMTYKIGITASSVDYRLYGLGLKMPSEFECDFAYEFDSEKYKKVEQTLHKILSMSNVGGEWFDLDADSKEGVREVCEMAGGKLVTDEVEKKIEEAEESGEETEINPVLGKIVERWNAVSDMKTDFNRPLVRYIRIPEIGKGGRRTVYRFQIKNRKLFIGLRCSGQGMDFPAIKILFSETTQINGRTFKGTIHDEHGVGVLETGVPLTMPVDEVIAIMKSLIDATKEKIVSGWVKE